MYQILLVAAKMYFDLILTSDLIYSEWVIQHISRDCSQSFLVSLDMGSFIIYEEEKRLEFLPFQDDLKITVS